MNVWTNETCDLKIELLFGSRNSNQNLFLFPQVCVLVLGSFTICWIPYFIVAMVQMFKIVENRSPSVYKICFTLAMANSGINPLIYAWKNTAFRKAFGRLLRCKMPDTQEPVESIRSNIHRKSSSIMPNIDMFNCSRAEMMGTPTSRGRLNSTDTDSAFEPIPMDSAPRGSISDSGVVVMIKHPRLSSISSEHRQSQNTISEELISNHTTMVTFSSSQDNDSELNDTPKRKVSIDSAFETKPPMLKLIRNKCAIPESFDSTSEDSPVKLINNNKQEKTSGTEDEKGPETKTTHITTGPTTINYDQQIIKTKTSKFHFNFKSYFRSKQTPQACRKNTSDVFDTTAQKSNIATDDNGHIRAGHTMSNNSSEILRANILNTEKNCKCNKTSISVQQKQQQTSPLCHCVRHENNETFVYRL